MKPLLPIILAAGLAAGSSAAFAQLRTDGGPPKILENIPAAGAVCRSEDWSDGAKVFDEADIAPDFSCAIGVEQLRALMSGPELVVADLRPRAAFAGFHIDAALNLTVSELAGKPYWRKRTVVLVGDGKAEHQRYVDCAHLKQAGYGKVHVLRGGLPQWIAHDQGVSGRVAGLGPMLRLSAVEFWLETKNPQNKVVLHGSLRALKDALPSATMVDSLAAQSLSPPPSRARPPAGAGPTAVVLATDALPDDASIEALARAVKPLPLLVYAGSAEDYRRQLARQEAVWAAKARGPKKPRCGN